MVQGSNPEFRLLFRGRVVHHRDADADDFASRPKNHGRSPLRTARS
jgi:hypothetical protein